MTTAPWRLPAPSAGPAGPFTRLGPEPLASALAALPAGAVEEFTASWDGLPADTHLGTDTPYRFRRYGTFRLREGLLERLPHSAFFQDKAVNKVNGGVPRMFAPLTDTVARSAALRTLVRALHGRLPGPRTDIDTCGVHQIRVTATASAEGLPAPEGVHQDGHAYVAQVLIRRQDVTGAESRLYDPARRLLHRTVLTTPLEAIVLDDRRVLHDVSPVRAAPGAVVGVRDMLLVDFFPGGGD
ncbi:2OG-Fe dioxygenase family protein [Streptomyces gamaensis]|uniref:2OG-Fe dioxygenase family protein n=1 Tax=Streptomyces gamaensis TaxID=1763542 RepID=A0ABW0Z0H3_9ACTN